MYVKLFYIIVYNTLRLFSQTGISFINRTDIPLQLYQTLIKTLNFCSRMQLILMTIPYFFILLLGCNIVHFTSSIKQYFLIASSNGTRLIDFCLTFTKQAIARVLFIDICKDNSFFGIQ